MILVDACVIIEYFKGNKDTVSLIENTGFNNLAVNSIVIMELFIGGRNKAELNAIKKRLNSFEFLDINQTILQDSTQLIGQFHLSHGLKIADAIIAATARFHEVLLFTYNIKDFRFIDGITLYTPNPSRFPL